MDGLERLQMWSTSRRTSRQTWTQDKWIKFKTIVTEMFSLFSFSLTQNVAVTRAVSAHYKMTFRLEFSNLRAALLHVSWVHCTNCTPMCNEYIYRASIQCVSPYAFWPILDWKMNDCTRRTEMTRSRLWISEMETVIDPLVASINERYLIRFLFFVDIAHVLLHIAVGAEFGSTKPAFVWPDPTVDAIVNF